MSCYDFIWAFIFNLGVSHRQNDRSIDVKANAKPKTETKLKRRSLCLQL